MLGGEPFEPQNQRVLTPFLKSVKERYPKKTIWCYTGYLFDRELCEKSRARCEVTDEMLALLDVLVDGRFCGRKKEYHAVVPWLIQPASDRCEKSLEQGSIAEWKPKIKRGID